MANERANLAVVASVVDRQSAQMRQLARTVRELGNTEERVANQAAKASAKMTAAKRQFTAAVNQASPAVGNLLSKLKGPAGLAVAGAAVGGVLGKAAIDAISFGDEIAKTSKKLGVGIEFLQEMRKAADDSGVSAQNLDIGLRSLGRRAADAARGQKEFAKGFEDLGVKVTRADGTLKSVEELLPEMADGFAKMSDGGRRTAAAMRTMGDSGFQLLPMLIGGSEALEEMRDRVSELGGVLSTQAVLQAERAKQAFGDFNFAMRNVWLQIGTSFIPWVTKLTESITPLVSKLGDWLNVTQLLKEELEDVSDDQLINLNARISETAIKLTEAEQKVKDYVAAGNVLANTSGFLSAGTQADKERFIELGETVTRLKGKLDSLILTRDVLAARLRPDSLGNPFKPLADDSKKLNDNLITTAVLLSNLGKIIKDAEDKEAALEANREAAIGRMEEGSQRRIKAIDEESDRQLQHARELDDQLNQMRIAELRAKFLSAFQIMDAGMQRFAQGVVEGNQSIGQSAKEASKVMITSSLDAARTAIMAAAADAAAKAFASQAGIPVVGPILGAIAASAAFAFVSAFVNKFEEGGLVRGGTPGKDSVPALLTPGEAVLPVALTKQLLSVFGNQGGRAPLPVGFAEGGMVGRQDAMAASGGINLNVGGFMMIPTRVERRRFVREIARDVMAMRERGMGF